MKNLIFIAAFVLGGVFCRPAWALEGLAQLQEAAKSDQHCECMIHEYTRRYNEVLRQYSRRKQRLTAQEQAEAHAQAMQWVREVWKFADAGVVEGQLNSGQFISATAVFRESQHASYPDLPVVH